jgi:Glyoxalase-like domain
MATRLERLVVDAADPQVLARWWAQALGWAMTVQEPHQVAVKPPEPHGLGVPLVFVPVADPKVGKNRSTWTYQASPPTTRPRWSPASPVVVPSPSTSARARMSHGWCR